MIVFCFSKVIPRLFYFMSIVLVRDNLTISSNLGNDKLQNELEEGNRPQNQISVIQLVDFSLFDSLSMDMIDVFEDDLNRMYFNKICPEPLVLSKFC